MPEKREIRIEAIKVFSPLHKSHRFRFIRFSTLLKTFMNTLEKAPLGRTVENLGISAVKYLGSGDKPQEDIIYVRPKIVLEMFPESIRLAKP